jgi:hypothetical protein
MNCHYQYTITDRYNGNKKFILITRLLLNYCKLRVHILSDISEL